MDLTGGIPARRGFVFQDHIAAGFCLEMLASLDLGEVWCETHDDITLLWKHSSGERVEFVQVKSKSSDQPWSASSLCKRPSGIGSSILERSLAHDCCNETTRFRVVTDVGVADALKFLKYAPDSLERLQKHQKDAQDLATDVTARLKDVASKNGLTPAGWILETSWSVTNKLEDVENANKWRLDTAIQSRGQFRAADQVQEIYDRLLRLVQKAAYSTDIAEKKITAQGFGKWLDSQVSNSTLHDPNGAQSKLVGKMEVAGLPKDYVEVALEERVHFRMKRLQRQYLSLSDQELIDMRITSELRDLRVQLDAGSIVCTGIEFHARCLDQLEQIMNSLPSELNLTKSYVSGCMYDITDRCLHRFTKI